MINLSRFTIRARLYLLGGVATVTLLVVGLFGVMTFRETQATFSRYVSSDAESIVQLSHLRSAVGNMRRFEKDMQLALVEGKDMAKSHEQWVATHAKGAKAIVAIRALDIPADIRQTLDGIERDLKAYHDGIEAFAARTAQRDVADLSKVVAAFDPVKANIRAVDNDLLKLTEMINKDAVEEVKHMDARMQRAMLMMGFVILAGALLMSLSIVSNIRSISRPLREVVDTSDRISRHDLTLDVEVHGRDETSAVLRGVQAMQTSLREVVGHVRESSDSIATASRQVAAGSMDLSSRTEQAASNLQQTAASMEELTASVRHNSESARQANGLARSAADVANKGAQVVGDVVSTMDRISDSSRKIGDIISVIDGIAFQTNILALNAAVEAARAGEQGRGFAVVAGEVRTLAQRSAEAAKEIKSLITASTENVDSGTRLVADAGATMQEVVKSVEQVSQIVSTISHATDEQSRGILQIGEAISSLDQMTQQNAALVEESAAAAQSLQQQADDLTRSVAVFRLR